MKAVNEILRKHRFRKDKTFVRFNATKYPYPTISIVVYYESRKVLERPIRYLDEFIEDLKRVKEIIDRVRVQSMVEKSEIQTDKTHDYESNNISDETHNYKSSSISDKSQYNESHSLTDETNSNKSSTLSKDRKLKILRS